MKRLFLAVIATCCLVAVPAAAQQRSPAAQPDVSEEIKGAQRYLVDLKTWASGYADVLTRQAELLGRVNEGVLVALDYKEKRQRKQGAAWGRTWAEERRADLRLLKETLGALPRTPPALTGYSRFMAQDPNLQRMTERFRRVPSLTAQQLASNEALILTVVNAAERAAGGDETAAYELSAGFFDLNAAMFETEARQYETYLEIGMFDEHPQGLIVQVTISFDRSIAATYRALKTEALGEPVDRVALGRLIRQNANEIRAAAADMPRRQRVAMGRIKGLETADGDFFARMKQAIDIYGEGVPAMLDLAATLDRMAVSVESELDGGEVDEALTAASPALLKLQEQDEKRRALIGGA